MKSRMFEAGGKRVKTWNPIVGCRHGCIYCYARELAEGRLKGTPKYGEGFKPKLWEPALKSRFHQGLVFVSDMGDAWGDWVPQEWIEKVLQVVRKSPRATFLFLTKNPGRYQGLLEVMPPNVVLGATIETNRLTDSISKAPSPGERAIALRAIALGVPGYHRMVSIEPILDFDLEPFVGMIKWIHPDFTYVGYNNHHHKLPEPPLAKVKELISELGKFTEVREKTIRKAWWEV